MKKQLEDIDVRYSYYTGCTVVIIICLSALSMQYYDVHVVTVLHVIIYTAHYVTIHSIHHYNFYFQLNTIYLFVFPLSMPHPILMDSSFFFFLRQPMSMDIGSQHK